MATNRFKHPYFLGLLATFLVAMVLMVLGAMAFISHANFGHLLSTVKLLLIVNFAVSIALSCAALHQIGQPALLGLLGIPVPLLPAILYMILPDKRAPHA
jgi:hypothetical protein